MQVIFKICCLYRINLQHFIETVDATGFVSVLYPIDSNHIQVDLEESHQAISKS